MNPLYKQRLSLERSIDELPRIVAFTEAFFKAADVQEKLRFTVDLLIEEVFVNLVKYNVSTHKILLELTPFGHGVKLRFTDFDVDKFDPRDAPQVDIEAPLSERTPGGLGVYLSLKIADHIDYEYNKRTSQLTITLLEKS